MKQDDKEIFFVYIFDFSRRDCFSDGHRILHSKANWSISADLDQNNIIDGNDLVILAGNFGKKN